MTATRLGGVSARPRPAPVVAVLAAVCAVAAVVWRAPVLVHQCVAGDGVAGALGLRLALLRPDVSCPSGTLAVGGEGAAAAGVVVVVAVPVLLLHLALVGAGAGMFAAATALVRGLGRLIGRVRPLPAAVALPAPAPSPRPVAADAPTLASWLLPTLGLRGPPAFAG